jgi:long-chain acyl-CoA synthetase
MVMSHANTVATMTAESTTAPELSCKDIYEAYLSLAHILELAAEVWTMSVISHVDELTML